MASKSKDCCELCSNYVYDEQFEGYVCQVNLDEDEMAHFILGKTKSCPYFSFGDEYAIVRKQN